MKLYLINFAVVICLILTLSTAQAENKSFGYQGRLTDNVGDPVSDGVYTFDFAIYTHASGGTLLWLENGVAVTSTDGLFSTQIGMVNSIPQDDLEGIDSLWLEVTVNSETLSPRSYLASTPFARTAHGLKSYSGFFGIDMIETISDFPVVLTYGDDGDEQIRIWGEGWGEILLNDEEINNYQDAALTTNGAGTGGSLFLRDNGATRIALEAGAVGNNSVVVPTDAISADEMLNEPGLASKSATTFFTLNSGNIDYTIDSIEIDVPTSGYVLVTATGYFNLAHINGGYTTVVANVEIDKPFSYTEGMTAARINFDATTGDYITALHCSRVFSANAGANKFYLNANYVQGSSSSTNIARASIKAIFFPTLYGSLTKSAEDNHEHDNLPIDGSVRDLNQKLTSITVADHKARLEAQRKEIEEEFAVRLQEIEKKLDRMSQRNTQPDN